MADARTPTTDTAVYLYLDTECIPTQDATLIAEIRAKHEVPAVDLSAIVAAANLTDPAKIEADIAKRRLKAMDDYDAAHEKAQAAAAEEYRKTCLDATTGHLAAISFAFGEDDGVMIDANGYLHTDQPTDYFGWARVTGGERMLLLRFFANIEHELEIHAFMRACRLWDAQHQTENGLWLLTVPGTDGKYMSNARDQDQWIEDRANVIPPVVVAHHAAFDLRYIWQRAIILGVEVPSWWPHDAKAWDTTKVQDTMTMWAGVGQRIGLDRLCKALGIQGKGDIDGSKVWDYVRAGKIAEVAQYCCDDVERLRAVHRRIIGLPHIGWGFLVEDEINGGSSAHWDANPPTDPGARDVFRTTEAEFDREEIERAEYRAEADAQRAYEDGEV